MEPLNKKSVQDIAVAGKRVLVRCDFNVPLKDGAITSDKRIVASLPTIEYLLTNNARVILCSHLGRPKEGVDPAFSLAPVAARLAQLLGKKVQMAQDVVGESAQALSAALQNGDVMLVENVRFEKGETKNDAALSRQFAALADIFVNDAFGSAHRAHSSTAGVADYLPAVCGFLIQKEIDFMGGALANPRRPLCAILGGAKVSDKIGVINNLLDLVDTLIIGGGMSYTFFAAKGWKVGTSICEEDKIALANEMMEKAAAKGVKMLLPMDTKIGREYAPDTEAKIVASNEIPADWMGLDIGPKTRELFADAIQGSGTIIWNGPMGVSEWDAFAGGTIAVAEAVAAASEKNGAISIIGGGDSAAAVVKLGFSDKMSHISTGGGASLEFLEGKVLPGIAALQDKD